MQSNSKVRFLPFLCLVPAARHRRYVPQGPLANRSYCACKVPFGTYHPPAFAAASLCHSSRACSSKSPSTPDSANLMIISNIVNYPVIGGINLPPPHMEQIGILFIVSDLVNYPVRGDLHEGPVTSAASTCHHFDQGTFLCYSHQSISLSFRPSALHCHFERAFPCHFDQAKRAEKSR